MLDLGWAELILIMAVAVLVIGPKEIPVVMRSLGRVVRRLQYLKFALSQQFDDFLKEHDLEEMRGGVDLKVIDDEKDVGGNTAAD